MQQRCDTPHQIDQIPKEKLEHLVKSSVDGLDVVILLQFVIAIFEPVL